MLHTATQHPPQATTPLTVARAPHFPPPAARAACEPQTAGDMGFITSRAVVKRRRLRCGHAAQRSASQGRFFAAGALCVPPYERRRGACGVCCKRRDGAFHSAHVQRRAASGASAATRSASSLSMSSPSRSIASRSDFFVSSRLAPATGFLASLRCAPYAGSVETMI